MATLEHTAVCHIQVRCFISLLPHHTFCVCSTKYDKAGPKIGGGVTLPICAVIKLDWAVMKSKLGSVKN